MFYLEIIFIILYFYWCLVQFIFIVYTMEEELKKQIAELKAQIANINKESSDSEQPNVGAVSVKLSSFWPNKPYIWFAQAESQFEIAGINKDATKYGYLLSVLDADMADEVEDVIAKPPSENKYENLKNELIKRFSTSREQRIRQLLSEQQMGDRKPSSFLRHLRSLAGKCDESIIRELWMRNLPPEVQRILMAQMDLPLDKVADLADSIMEAPFGKSASVNATSAPFDLEKVMRRIDELDKKIDAIGRYRTRSRSNSSTRSRPRSTSRSGKSGECWYHRRFGTKAAKCINPCSWKPGQTGKAVSNQ